MAEAKILKKTRRQVVVKAVGTGAHYANLTSFLHESSNTTNHIVVDQFFSEANAVCTINDIIFSVDGNANIIREANGFSNVVLTVTAGQSNFSFSQYHGFTVNEDANANIRIDFGSNSGTIILCLTKGEGFNDPNLQILADYQRP